MITQAQAESLYHQQMRQAPGTPGSTGPEGPPGTDGADGPEGPEGDAGPGVAVGGGVGQVLYKLAGVDYVTGWFAGMYLDQTTGNVGIGTTAPNISRLRVNAVQGSGTLYLTGGNLDPAYSPALSSMTGGSLVVGSDRSAGDQETDLVNAHHSSGVGGFSFYGNDLGTGTITPLMRIEGSTGYIGIGTSAPVSRVSVTGGGDLLEAAQIKVLHETTRSFGGGGVLLHHLNDSGGLPFAGDRLGYVLFGTTSDGLNIQGAGVSAYAAADFSPTSVPTDFNFETAPAGTATRLVRMRITSEGRVGIGVVAPTCTLDVVGPVRVGQYAKAALPGAPASGAGAVVYVNDEAGGAVLAFSDGANWRRVTDRAVVS